MAGLDTSLAELYELQLIDNEIIANVRRIRVIEKDDSPVQKKYHKLTARLARIDDEQSPIKKEINVIDDEVTRLTSEKRECEDKLFSPEANSDPKMLQSLQAKREQIAKQIKSNEDSKIKKQITLDNIETRKVVVRQQLEEIEEEYQNISKERVAEKETLTARVEVLKKERVRFKKFEDRKLLALYQRLQRENDGVAIATIEDDVCNGCCVSVSTATMQKLKYSDDIVNCPRCGRILYLADKD